MTPTQSPPTVDWLIRRDILKAAHGLPFAEQTIVYAPPLEWSSEHDTIHGARIRPLLLQGTGGYLGPVGWVMRLDYVDAPIRVYVHWLWRLGCDPPWIIYDAHPYGDMSTPHSTLEVGAWESAEEARHLEKIHFLPLRAERFTRGTYGLTHSVRDFDAITAAIARVIEEGYTLAGLREALEGIAA